MNNVFTLDSRRSKVNPQCFRCKHARTLMVDPSCDAFPDGIPMEIWVDRHNHETPYPGDHGIQFEQRPMNVTSDSTKDSKK